jgi:catalase
VNLAVVAPRIGTLESGVNATASYIATSSIFYDAIFIGSLSSGSNSTGSLTLVDNAKAFITEPYSHGKAIGALGGSGAAFMQGLGLAIDSAVAIQRM